MMSKALIVDDSKTIRMILGKILRELGYEVCEAIDGKDALKVIEAQKAAVDLVFADWNMPEMNGLDLVKHLRQNPDLSSTEGDYGDNRNRGRPHGIRLRSGRRRICHEAVYKRHS